MSFARRAAGAVARGNAGGGGKRREAGREPGLHSCPRKGARDAVRAAAPNALPTPSATPTLPPQAAGSPARPAPGAGHSSFGIWAALPTRPREARPSHPPGTGARGGGCRRGKAEAGATAPPRRRVGGLRGVGRWRGRKGTVGTVHHARIPVLGSLLSWRRPSPLWQPPQPLGAPQFPPLGPCSLPDAPRPSAPQSEPRLLPQVSLLSASLHPSPSTPGPMGPWVLSGPEVTPERQPSISSVY